MPSPAPPEPPAPKRDVPEETGAVRYRCTHVTRYLYDEPVTASQLVAHLAPRPCGRQRGGVARLTIRPWPATAVDALDWFGNPVTYAAIEETHRELVVTAELDVSVRPAPAPSATPAWERVRDAARGDAETAEFLHPSPRVPLSEPGLADLASPCFPAALPVAEGVVALMTLIRDGFAFDPTATTVSTPVADVLRLRKGVCQDFAHLMIGALRATGIPARYVSGYLRTLPPPGQERLRGADASHAWVQAWCGPDTGWLDLDPTNGKLADTDHITLAWGRDYDDVCPLRGVVLGGGAQRLEVSVDVEAV